MRFPLAPTVGILVLAAHLTPDSQSTARAADAKFPYKAAVTAPEAALRAGPGESYYSTEKVAPGTTLEVYHRRADGWLAVRPLPESFSWVSSRHLKLSPDGLAEVTDDRVASRVGSQSGDIRDVVQVRLKRGEMVELVDSRAATAGPTPWHKIVPPAGEFRWIEERFVDGKATATTPAGPAVGSLAANAAPGSTATPAADSAPAMSAAVAPGAVALPPSSVATLSADRFRAELDDINAQLSLLLAQPPSQWQCDVLTQRVQALLSQTQDAAQRSEARALAQRIAQAEDVRSRYQMPAARSIDGLLARRPGGAASRSADSRYDGAGRLVHVEPGRIGGPRYALVDDRGRVLHYVTPAPGVNLNYYVGRRVGVVGTRSTTPDQDSELVTARHIAPLEGRVR